MLRAFGAPRRKRDSRETRGSRDSSYRVGGIQGSSVSQGLWVLRGTVSLGVHGATQAQEACSKEGQSGPTSLTSWSLSKLSHAVHSPLGLCSEDRR